MPCAQTFNKYYFQSYNRSTTNSCKEYAAFFFNIRLFFGNNHLVIFERKIRPVPSRKISLSVLIFVYQPFLRASTSPASWWLEVAEEADRLLVSTSSSSRDTLPARDEILELHKKKHRFFRGEVPPLCLYTSILYDSYLNLKLSCFLKICSANMDKS